MARKSKRMTAKEWAHTPDGQKHAADLLSRAKQLQNHLNNAKRNFVGDDLAQHTDESEREWRVKHELRNATGLTAGEYEALDVAEVAPMLDAARATKTAAIRGEAPKDAPPALDAECLAVLCDLRDNAPQLRKQVEIEAATNISKKTVGVRIAYLERNGYATRPNGPNKGATITPAGQILADRLCPKSTR